MNNDETWTVSIDAGGTFTDAIARSSTGDSLVAKVASTPHDPAQGLTNSVSELVKAGMPLTDVSLICHGTTVATNAMLTDEFAKVALITTKGFRDVLAYRHGNRPAVYSLSPDRPAELVERYARLEVDERVSSDGRILVELSDDEIDDVVARIAEIEPEAIAISLLFSYLNSSHERKLHQRLRERFPDVPITASSDVAREFREYPRTATTVLNAALRPVVGGYLERARTALFGTGLEAPFQVMQSNGGCVPSGRADEQAHRLILSGPAGGVSGLVNSGKEHGISNLISLDMGGTSVDICLVRDGQIPFTNVQTIRDHALLAPTVDIHTLGAGGGSIAWVDRTNRLRVGPQSARAVPGPACYARGGTEPTLTDAHVVLGTLGTSDLAGNLALDREASQVAVGKLGEQLGMDVYETAEAILAIAIAHMIRGLRKVSVERGLDPRDFTLFPFGGAGPLHAGMLLKHLGLSQVIVPKQPGLFSADGLLAAGLRSDDSQTVLQQFTPDRLPEISDWFAERSGVLREQVIKDGADPETISTEIRIDCRYLGQGFELPVELDSWGEKGLREIPDKYHLLHHELYGHASRNEPVELVTLRIAVTGQLHRKSSAELETGGTEPPREAIIGYRPVRLPGSDIWTDAAVVDRTKLKAGNTILGPAIIKQMDATTVLLAEQLAVVAANGDMVLTEAAGK